MAHWDMSVAPTSPLKRACTWDPSDGEAEAGESLGLTVLSLPESRGSRLTERRCLKTQGKSNER